MHKICDEYWGERWNVCKILHRNKLDNYIFWFAGCHANQLSVLKSYKQNPKTTATEKEKPRSNVSL